MGRSETTRRTTPSTGAAQCAPAASKARRGGGGGGGGGGARRRRRRVEVRVVGGCRVLAALEPRPPIPRRRARRAPVYSGLDRVEAHELEARRRRKVAAARLAPRGSWCAGGGAARLADAAGAHLGKARGVSDELAQRDRLQADARALPARRRRPRAAAALGRAVAAHEGVAAPVEVRAAAKGALAVRAHVADDGAGDVAERLPALGLESEERLLAVRCGVALDAEDPLHRVGRRHEPQVAAALHVEQPHPAAADGHHPPRHVRERQLGRAAQLFSHARAHDAALPRREVPAVAQHLDQHVARRAAVGRRRVAARAGEQRVVEAGAARRGGG